MRIVINKNDLKFETFKSSGPGGQNKNKRETAVRYTHKQTGIVAECSDQRTQGQNRQVALERLADKLLDHYRTEQRKGLLHKYLSKEDVAFGNQKRTYWLAGTARVVDHETGVEANPHEVLNGHIDLLLRGNLLNEHSI